MMREVVVTGCGIVSPIGTNVAEFQHHMFAGTSGVKDIRGCLVASNFPVPFAARVPDTLGHPKLLNDNNPPNMPNSWRFAAMATEEALCSLPEGLPIDAIVYGTDDGVRWEAGRDSFRHFDSDNFDWHLLRGESSLEPIREIIENRGNGRIDDRDVISLNNACATGTQAIGIAFHRIRAAVWKRVVAGGVYARCTESNLMNFHMLGALSVANVAAAEASCPFSKDRSGFVRGEGAATLILEDRESAEARGAPILGFVRGYAATSDAYRLTDPRPDVTSSVRMMESAIADARLNKADISAISAHGTSTPMNDKLETLAIKQVFGPAAYRIPVVSLKSQVGHSAIAAGAFEAVASLLMLSHQRLAPTINYKEIDPECDLDYVPNTSRPAALRVIMSNSFGFGGQNACAVFERGVE